MPPGDIARNRAGILATDNVVTQVQAGNGELHFFVNRDAFGADTVGGVEKLGEKYGESG